MKRIILGLGFACVFCLFVEIPARAQQEDASAAPALAIGGSGTTNFVPMFTPNGSTLGNSAMFQTGGPGLGGRVGVGTKTPTAKEEIRVGSEGTRALRLVSGPNAFLDIIPTNISGRFQTVFDTFNGRDIVFAGATRNVGIGTTTPAAKEEIRVGSEGTRALRLDSGPNAFLDIVPTNISGRFQTVFDTVNGRDFVFAGGTQNVGIGTTTPTAKEEIRVGSEGTLALRLDSGPNAFLDIVPTNIGGRFQTVFDTVNGRDIVFAGATQNVGIGTVSPNNTLEVVENGTTLADAWSVRSSRRYKTNIQPLEGALEKIERLQGVSYQRKSDGKHEIGVIAEDVAQVVPEVVSRDARTQEAQGVDYARMTALLIEAVKAQQAEIRQLKTQLGRLVRDQRANDPLDMSYLRASCHKYHSAEVTAYVGFAHP